MLADLWHNLFFLDAGVSLIEKVVRTVIVYLFLMIGLRVAGKRELAQLNPFDLIVLLMLSNTVQNAIIGNDNSLVGGIIGALTLLAVNWLMVRFVRRNRRAARLLEGRPDVLIRDGLVQRDHLEREMITRAELTAAAHKQGIVSLHDVERAILEPTGTISFISKRPTPDSERHAEIMVQLRAIADQLAAARAGSADHGG